MVATSVSARGSGDGFSAEVIGDARRQLRLSLAVVVMLAIGIVSAAVSVGTHPLPVRREAVSITPVVTLHAEANAVGAAAI